MAEFKLGFAALAELIPTVVGVPLEDERHDSPNGDGLQATLMPNGARGLMVWRKEDNWTAFTDGYRTWVNGPLGLQERLNTERFDWELDCTPENRVQETPTVTDIISLLPVAPWNPRPRRSVRGITKIVGHWDGGVPIPTGYNPISYYKIEAFGHIALDWGGGSHGYGLMYHEVISRDGRVWITREPEDEVWAQTRANPFSYAIKLDATVGQDPTTVQLESFRQRIDFNRGRFQVSQDEVHGHGELTQYGNQTQCPGKVAMTVIRDYRG